MFDRFRDHEKEMQANRKRGLLTLSEALNEGRKLNKAFRDPRWYKGLYAYHGMDNQVCFSDGSEFVFSIAAVSHPIYELCNKPYNGPLSKKRRATRNTAGKWRSHLE